MFIGSRKKEGVGKPAPQSGIAYYGYIIYNNFWQLVALNIVFLLCCIPIITIPAALTAVNRVFIKLIRERNVLFFEEYFCEFKRSFFKTIPLGIFFSLLLLFAYYLLSLGVTNNNLFGLLFNGIGFCIAILAICYGEYVFTLVAVQDLSNKVIMKNAFLLMLIGWKTTLAILALNLFCICFLMYTFPISLIFFVIGILIIKQYTVCWLANDLFNIYIIKKEA